MRAAFVPFLKVGLGRLAVELLFFRRSFPRLVGARPLLAIGALAIVFVGFNLAHGRASLLFRHMLNAAAVGTFADGRKGAADKTRTASVTLPASALSGRRKGFPGSTPGGRRQTV